MSPFWKSEFAEFKAQGEQGEGLGLDLGRWQEAPSLEVGSGDP